MLSTGPYSLCYDLPKLGVLTTDYLYFNIPYTAIGYQ